MAAPQTLVSIIQKQANERPNKVAFNVIDASGSTSNTVTYTQLRDNACSYAELFSSLIGRGKPVVVLCESGIEYITTLLGLMWSGNVPVPAYPPRSRAHFERLSRVVDDSSASWVVTQQHIRARRHFDRLEDLGVKSIVLEAASNSGKLGQFELVDDDGPALIQYTSGSTGAPKGVPLTHANICAGVGMIVDAYGAIPSDVGVFWLPPYHDMGLIGGIFTPLFAGFTSNLIDPAVFARDPGIWLRALSDLRATVTAAPNFAFDLAADRLEDAGALDLSSVRLMINGAEKVRISTINRFEKALESAGLRPHTMVPSYGLAEATLLVTSRTLEQANLFVDENVSCGMLGNHIDAVLLDENTSCASLGEGEICIAGPSVFDGYWNREKGAEFVEYEGREYFRTGDIGKFVEKDLVVSGRIKEMMCIRGKNIFPYDIESSVTDLIRKDLSGYVATFAVDIADQEEPVLFCEIAYEASLDYPEMCKSIRQYVARVHGISIYSIWLVRKGFIPRTSSGKIRRNKCAELFVLGPPKRWVIFQGDHARGNNTDLSGGELSSDSTTHTAQNGGTDVAPILLAVAKSILKTDKIDLSDGFFELGGDSLSVLAFLGELEDRGYTFELDVIYECESFNDLLPKVQAIGPTKRESTSGLMADLTPIQRRYFGDYLVDRSKSWSNIFQSFQVPEFVNREKLSNAMEAVCSRHAALRSCFVFDDGRLRQMTMSEVSVDVEESFIDSPEAFTHFSESFANHRFNLNKCPLFRVSLVEYLGQKFVFANFHHAILDGWSLVRIREELSRLILSDEKLESSRNDELEAVSRAISKLEANYVEAREYWLEEFSSPWHDIVMPSNFETVDFSDYRGHSRSVLLNARAEDSIVKFCRANSTSVSSLFMAVLFFLVHKESGEGDLVIGTPINARNRVNDHNLVGLFINLAMVRAKECYVSFDTTLREVTRKLNGANQYQIFQTDELAHEIGYMREAHRLPFTNLFYTHLDFQEMTKPENANEHTSTFKDLIVDVRYDMMWYVNQYSDGIEIECKYRRAMYSDDYVEQLVFKFQEITHQILRKNEDENT